MIVIFYLSLIIWLFPPVRNYKTKYFYFFLILALNDPAVLILNQIFNINPVRVNILAGFLIIISLIKLQRGWRTYFLILFSFGLVYISIAISTTPLWIITIILFFSAMILLIKDFIISIMESESWNLFYIIMILYILSIIIKIIYLLHYAKTGMAYFVITSAFQILIGLYFSFYNVDNSKKIGVFSLNKNNTP